MDIRKPIILKLKNKDLYVRHKKNKTMLVDKIHQATIYDNYNALSQSIAYGSTHRRLKQRTGYYFEDFIVMNAQVAALDFIIKYLH